MDGFIGLERCPTCYKLPEIKIEDKGFDKVDFMFHCEEHGHKAQGQTVEVGAANWNIYCRFIKAQVAR